MMLCTFSNLSSIFLFLAIVQSTLEMPWELCKDDELREGLVLQFVFLLLFSIFSSSFCRNFRYYLKRFEFLLILDSVQCLPNPLIILLSSPLMFFSIQQLYRLFFNIPSCSCCPSLDLVKGLWFMTSLLLLAALCLNDLLSLLCLLLLFCECSCYLMWMFLSALQFSSIFLRMSGAATLILVFPWVFLLSSILRSFFMLMALLSGLFFLADLRLMVMLFTFLFFSQLPDWQIFPIFKEIPLVLFGWLDSGCFSFYFLWQLQYRQLGLSLDCLFCCGYFDLLMRGDDTV